MNCTPENGFIAINANVFWNVIFCLLVLAIGIVIFQFDRHVLRPGIRLKKRRRDWDE